jgi:hypothetical protein
MKRTDRINFSKCVAMSNSQHLIRELLVEGLLEILEQEEEHDEYCT